GLGHSLGSSVAAPSPSLGPSFRGSSSSRMISMNITSPLSPLEQTNFALEDRGTNPSDSSIEFSFRTCSVVMEANGSGCLGWIVMALIELWMWVEHCESSVGYSIGDGLQHSVDFVGHLALLLFEIAFKLGYQSFKV
ncbi:hypothetical protein Tco_1494790, partial [Tanacetum coccineum]